MRTLNTEHLIPITFIGGQTEVLAEPEKIEWIPGEPIKPGTARTTTRPLRAYELDPVTETVKPSSKTLDTLAEELKNAVRVSIDTETHIDSGQTLVVISLATRQRDGSLTGWTLHMRDVDPALLKAMLALIRAYCWNGLTFDYPVLETEGLFLKEWRDAMNVDAELNAGDPGFDWYHSLQWAARYLCNIEMSGKGDVQKSYEPLSDLSFDQIIYAAQDTVITLLVADKVREEMVEAKLEQATKWHVKAGLAIAKMELNGVPIRKDAYFQHVEDSSNKAVALAELARLTGEDALDSDGKPGKSDMSIDGSLEPDWNPGSNDELKDRLNRFETEAVKKALNGRLLNANDPVDASMLKGIGGPISKQMLLLRSSAKTEGTYGTNLEVYMTDHAGYFPEFGKTGKSKGSGRFIRNFGNVWRLFGQFKQHLTGTSRLASDKTNLQNTPPEMNEFITFEPDPNGNSDYDRVDVHSDLAAAEMRTMAGAWGEQALIDAFEQGADPHEVTARKMFGDEEMDRLAREDHAGFKNQRGKAKSVNFGQPYGLTGPGMAKQFRDKGIQVTDDEMNQAVKDWQKANPALAQVLAERDEFVETFANRPPPIDWQLSFRLLRLWISFNGPNTAWKKKTGSLPTGYDLATEAATPDEVKVSLLKRNPSSAEVVRAYEADVALVDGAKAEHSEILSRSRAIKRSMTAKRKEIKATSAQAQSLDLEGTQEATVSELPNLSELQKELASLELELAEVQTALEAKDSEVETLEAALAANQDEFQALMASITDEAVEEEYQSRADEIHWAFSFNCPLVLGPDGKPVQFESRTLGGQRRLFRVPMWGTGDKFPGILLKVVQLICMDKRGEVVAFRKQFAEVNGLVELEPGIAKAGSKWVDQNKAITGAFNKKNKDSKKFMLRMINEFTAQFGNGALSTVLARAFKDGVRSQKNAYRNHPIQGSVADMMFMCFGLIEERGLPEGAFIIRSVHDSLDVECYRKDAVEVASICKWAWETSMRFYVPNVVAKADVVCTTSFDEERDWIWKMVENDEVVYRNAA